MLAHEQMLCAPQRACWVSLKDYDDVFPVASSGFISFHYHPPNAESDCQGSSQVVAHILPYEMRCIDIADCPVFLVEKTVYHTDFCRGTPPDGKVVGKCWCPISYHNAGFATVTTDVVVVAPSSWRRSRLGLIRVGTYWRSLISPCRDAWKNESVGSHMYTGSGGGDLPWRLVFVLTKEKDTRYFQRLRLRQFMRKAHGAFSRARPARSFWR